MYPLPISMPIDILLKSNDMKRVLVMTCPLANFVETLGPVEGNDKSGLLWQGLHE